MGSLERKVALVTGAGRGIGRQEALLLASEGASVIVNDLGSSWEGVGSDSRPTDSVVAEISVSGGRAIANHASVTDSDAVKRMVDQAIDEFGGLDIVVNNAGVLRDRMVFNLDPDDLLTVLMVHVVGHFNVVHHASAYWREQSKLGNHVSGRIINTTSSSGLFGNVGQASYGAAKAAIASLTQIASLELASYGVTANAICPTARTRLTEMGSRSSHDHSEALPEPEWDPLDPANVAPLVAFLASDAASGITGHIFGVYGSSIQLYEGWSMGPEIRSSYRQFRIEEIAEKWKQLFLESPSVYGSPLERLRVALRADLKDAGFSS